MIARLEAQGWATVTILAACILGAAINHVAGVGAALPLACIAAYVGGTEVQKKWPV